MYRIDDETSATSMPPPEEAGSEGFFIEGDPATGVPATIVRASWLNMVQEELRTIVEAGGLTPTKEANSQVLEALLAKFARRITTASGEADQIIGIFKPLVKNLSNGMSVLVRASLENTSKSPTFQADETEAKDIVKCNGLPLEAGDISGAGHWLELHYDEELDKWVLQNPAKGINQSSGIPVGGIAYFAMKEPPVGYLHANGAAIGRDTYPGLFAAIGTVFGAGDGERTFNLPDLRGEFVRGWDDGRGVDGGRVFGSAQGDAIRNITGTAGYMVGSGSGTTGVFDTPVASGYLSSGSGSSAPYRNINFDASRVVPTASETRTRNIALLACIKAFDAATNPEMLDVTELANEMADKANRDELIVSTIIYPNGGTAASPANVTANQRIVMDNPYAGYYVHCEAQVLIDGQWGNPGWASHFNASAGLIGNGVRSAQTLPTGQVVIKTGDNGIAASPGSTGSVVLTSYIAALPCRIIVTRLGKIQ